ncbi:MAG: pyrroline-5-carboxylate reductase [Oscillospiraceae bacterium]|nr:pyrroline-5-carboxylate reductase [Oscillospiraceae bacterium]
MEKIGFLGFGNMASAIAKGILSVSHVLVEVSAYDPFPQTIEQFQGKVKNISSAQELINTNKYIFLCVKPQMLSDALSPISDAFCDQHIVVSIVAGVTVEHIKDLIDNRCPVVRTMPNTPLLLSSGTTAISKPDDISATDYELIKSIFQSVGSVYEIHPDRFNEVIPVNGSSPAFIYLFAKIIAEQAAEYGLDYDSSLKMISDTLIGSAKMIIESGKSVDELIDNVSSKGGTTVAALQAMQQTGFSEALAAGFVACVERAYELGKTT